MKRLTRFALPVLALTLWAVGCDRSPGTLDDIGGPDFSQSGVEGQYIVVLNDNASPAAVAATFGLERSHTYGAALTGFSATIPDAAREALERHSAVRWIEPVRVKQLYGFQQIEEHKEGHKGGKGGGGGGGGDKPCKGKKCPPPPPPTPGPCVQGASVPGSNDIDANELYGIEQANAPASSTWDNSPVDVDIAIIDSGADTDHDDLCIHTAVDFTGEGFEDFNGHGSHTSGTAAARDDNDPPGQVVGMAPSARIWSVKVCNVFGLCPTNAIVAGVDYVTANASEIDVANMSLGGGGSDQAHPVNPIDCSPISGDAEHLAICNSVAAGVTYAVAAGNSAADASGFTPAAFDEVITVSAADVNEQPASFTNYGTDVDLIAAGVSVKSTWLANGYNTISGTSMASPHVAGAAALYIAANPGMTMTPFAVQQALVAAARAWSGQGGNHPEPMLDVTGFGGTP